MSEIEFHFNVPDKLAYSCRLLRKAHLSGACIAVTAEPGLLAELDALLWGFGATEFVPHCTDSAAATTLAVTPIVLTAVPANAPQHDVLVNLGRQVPTGFQGFRRFIEVVSLSPEDVQSGRRRWKHYAAHGYALKRYDLAKAGGAA
jgi:DNA polymerase III subunit chi